MLEIFLPRLVVLLRDFMLETPKSFKDYFLEKLDDVDPEGDLKTIHKIFINLINKITKNKNSFSIS